MGEALDNHELPGYEFSIGTGEGSISAEAKRIVGEKYTLTKAFADDYSAIAQGFIDDVKETILQMVDFEPTITVEELDLTLEQDWQSLINAIPVSPLTSDDYNIQLPTGLEWNFNAEAYVSALLVNLQAEFNDILTNKHDGLDTATRDAMWAWESEKDALALAEAKEKIADNMASRGFEEDSLGLFHSMEQADVEYMNKRLDKARKIVEDTYKASLMMLQKTMEEGVKLEGVSQDYWIKFNNLRLEAAKETVEYGLKVIDIAIKKLEAKVGAYEMEVRAYVARVGAIKAIIDAQVAIIEGKVKYIIAKIQAQIAELDAKIKLLQMKYGVEQDATMKLAQLAAQVTASALSAFNASASISGGFSASLGEAKQFQEVYEHKEDVTP